MQRPLLLIVLVLATVVLVTSARVVLGGKTWDDTRYHTEIAPSRLASADAVLAGELPAWWDGTGFGVPLIAEPSHGAAYPPVWLAASPHALDLVWIFHVLWLALGVAIWARARGASEIAAVSAAVLVATSGIVASAALRGVLPAIAHVPWIAWAASQRRYALAGLFVGLCALAGELAVLVDAAALALIVAGAAAKSPGASARSRGQGQAQGQGQGHGARRWVVVAIVMGLAIGALQWVPAVFSVPESAGTTMHGISVSRWLELLVPAQLGSIHALGGSHAWFPGLYVGAPLLALAVVGRPTRPIIGYVLALVVLAFVAGRGGWPWWLGAPDLHLAVLAIALAPHAATGLDTLLAHRRGVDNPVSPDQRRAFIALGGGAVLTAITLGALGALRSRVELDADSDVLGRALLDGGIAVVCMAGAVLAAWRAKEPLRTLLVVVLVIAPAVGSQGGIAPMTDRGVVAEIPAWARSALAPPPPARVEDVPAWVSGMVAPRAPVRVYRPLKLFGDVRDPEPVGPVELEDAIGTLAGTSAARWGVAAARSEDPARPPDHDRAWLASAGAGAQLLSRFGISLAILPRAIVEGQRGFTELGRRNTWSLVAYAASPPAAVVNEWLWIADDASALARLFPPGARRGLDDGVVIVRGSGRANQDEPSPPRPCAIERWDAGAIDVTCTADGDAYAVVTSTPRTGWSVSVDGRDVEWNTVDVLRRGVAISAGTHRITWRYAIPGLRYAIIIACLGVAGLFALWLVTRKPAPGS